MSIVEQVGAKVRRIRTERGLRSRQVADQAGLSLRFYSQLEAGDANISIARLESVAEALGTTLADLVTEDTPVRKRIALLGLRGAGKSTVGPMLARLLEVPFVELDDRIEEAAGLELAEVFALHDEPYYRRLEAECLESLERKDGACVIAMPGGIVNNEKAAPIVFNRFLTIWLKARPEEHMQRVLDQGDRRPMANRINAMAELRSILAERRPLYRKADLAFETSGHKPKQVVKSLVRSVAQTGWRPWR